MATEPEEIFESNIVITCAIDQAETCVSDIVPFSNAVQTDKHALPGEACVIDLPVVDSNPAPHIKWMQQDGTAITPDSLRFRFHISLRNQLILLEVKLTDNGKSYRAEAKNVYIPSMVSHSQTFFLRVPRKY